MEHSEQQHELYIGFIAGSLQNIEGTLRTITRNQYQLADRMTNMAEDQGALDAEIQNLTQQVATYTSVVQSFITKNETAGRPLDYTNEVERIKDAEKLITASTQNIAQLSAPSNAPVTSSPTPVETIPAQSTLPAPAETTSTTADETTSVGAATSGATVTEPVSTAPTAEPPTPTI